jgi:hypothetical protein
LKGYSAILVPLAVHMNDAAFHGGADVSDRRAVTLGPVGATPRPATASIAADRIDVDTSALLAFFDDLFPQRRGRERRSVRGAEAKAPIHCRWRPAAATTMPVSCESPIDRGGVHKPLEISAGQG